jgi:hypothetical protein
LRGFEGFCFITFHKKKKKKKRSVGHKNGIERRVWQFYTICDKNQLLRPKIEKVMAVLVPRWLDFS